MNQNGTMKHVLIGLLRIIYHEYLQEQNIHNSKPMNMNSGGAFSNENIDIDGENVTSLTYSSAEEDVNDDTGSSIKERIINTMAEEMAVIEVKD